MDVPKLDREKLWNFVPCAQVGSQVKGGECAGDGGGDPAVTRRLWYRPVSAGRLEWLHRGEANITQPIARVQQDKGGVREIAML